MWWKIGLLVLAVPLVAILLVAIAGSMLPKTHTASRRVRYERPPDAVWAVIADLASHPSWRKDVREVRRLPDRDGQPVWQEVRQRGDTMNMQVIEFDPPRRMVTRVVDNKMFGGTWTWEVRPDAGSGSTLTITENGEIYNPIFRFVARYVMGYRGTMDGVHRSLAASLGQNIQLDG